MIAPTPEVLVNTRQASRTLYILGARSQNLRVPFTGIKNLMVADHVRNFESGGSLFGGWPPASPESWQGRGLLEMTGAMRDALGRRSGPGVKIRKYEVRVGVGTKNEEGEFYARFHQSGATEGRRGDLPKREVVGITDSTRERGVEMIRRYIVGR